MSRPLTCWNQARQQDRKQGSQTRIANKDHARSRSDFRDRGGCLSKKKLRFFLTLLFSDTCFTWIGVDTPPARGRCTTSVSQMWVSEKVLRNGKPTARSGRKATDLSEMAGLPKSNLLHSNQSLRFSASGWRLRRSS